MQNLNWKGKKMKQFYMDSEKALQLSGSNTFTNRIQSKSKRAMIQVSQQVIQFYVDITSSYYLEIITCPSMPEKLELKA